MYSFFLFLVAIGTTIPAHASFSDADTIEQWALPAVETLYNEGIISGNDDGSFAPDRPMNRAEFSKLVVTATNVTRYLPLQSRFPDIQKEDWFFDFIETARQYGWVSGYPDGTFQPGGTINRAEVAKILTLAFSIPVGDVQEGDDWSMPYFRALSDAQLLPYGVTLENIDKSHTPSRIEITDQIYRCMKYTGKLSSDEESSQTSLSDTQLPSTFDPTTESNQTDRGDVTPTTSDAPLYEYTDTMPQTMPLSPNAGTLYVEKTSSLARRVTLSKNTTNVPVHAITFRSQSGTVRLGGMYFRLMGTAGSDVFKNLWLESNDETVSEKISVEGDIIYIPFNRSITITSSSRPFVLKADLGSTPTPNAFSRLVLYRPDWIDANTEKKIGFFPLGGTDISLQ